MNTSNLINRLVTSLEPAEFVETVCDMAEIGVRLRKNDKGLWDFTTGGQPVHLNMCAEETPYFEIVYANGTTKVVPAVEDEAIPLHGAVECNYTDDAILLTIDEDTEAYGTMDDVIEAIGDSL